MPHVHWMSDHQPFEIKRLWMVAVTMMRMMVMTVSYTHLTLPTKRIV